MPSGVDITGKRATLAEILDHVDDLNDELTIYASDHAWHAGSEAVVSIEPEDGSIPSEAMGLRYFLEFGLAKEVLRVWSIWRGNSVPTSQERYEAVI